MKESRSLEAITTKEGWRAARAEVVRGMQVVVGPLPEPKERAPLEVRIEKEAVTETYIRRLISYQSEPGCRTPAYLCIPSDALDKQQAVPAILCLHPTDMDVGHGVVVGLGGREGRAYAAELAERGYVTLSPAYPHMADYWPNLDELGYESGTMKAIWDNIRGLDLLAEMPEVDDSRGFAAIGHSLGGHNAIYTAVFEPRITVLASSCGFDSFQDYYGGIHEKWKPGKGWCQARYMPRMANYDGRLHEIPFDFPNLLSALAPRPVFVSAPFHDDNFQWQSVDKCVDVAQTIYRLFDGENRIVINHPDCGHDFPDQQRKMAYKLFDQVLRCGNN